MAESVLKTAFKTELISAGYIRLTTLILLPFLEYFGQFHVAVCYKKFLFIFNGSKFFPAVLCNMNATCFAVEALNDHSLAARPQP
jgi:hypothetical protein